MEKNKRYRGKVWGYRGDGYPLVETDGTAAIIVLTKYRVKPKKGDEVEFQILEEHGNITTATRLDDLQ